MACKKEGVYVDCKPSQPQMKDNFNQVNSQDMDLSMQNWNYMIC